MPKSLRRRGGSRHRGKRSSFRRTNRTPYGNRYGNDAFVKCETIEPLATGPDIDAGEQVFSTMRTNTYQAVAPGNTYLAGNEEFLQFQPLYARYEIRGMKAEVTLSPKYVWQAANLGAGMAPYLNNPAEYPSMMNNVTYPQ